MKNFEIFVEKIDKKYINELSKISLNPKVIKNQKYLKIFEVRFPIF